MSFVSKEKFLKTAGVKSNHENMMESNDGMFFYHGSKNEGTSFLGDSLNKNISRKKIMRLFNEQSSSHFEVFWKTSASKTYKSSHQEVFSKIGVLKILTSHNGLYDKILEKPLMESIFIKWQLEAFNFIKFKNKLLRN